MTAEKAAPGSNHPRSAGMTRRWAMLLMGRNSVSPWTRPRTLASKTVMPPPSGLLTGPSSDLDDHGPIPRAVQFHKHQALPGSEPEAAPLDRHRLAGTQDRRFDVRRGIIVNPVMSPPALRDQSRQGIQDVRAHV